MVPDDESMADELELQSEHDRSAGVDDADDSDSEHEDDGIDQQLVVGQPEQRHRECCDLKYGPD